MRPIHLRSSTAAMGTMVPRGARVHETANGGNPTRSHRFLGRPPFFLGIPPPCSQKTTIDPVATVSSLLSQNFPAKTNKPATMKVFATTLFLSVVVGTTAQPVRRDLYKKPAYCLPCKSDYDCETSKACKYKTCVKSNPRKVYGKCKEVIIVVTPTKAPAGGAELPTSSAPTKMPTKSPVQSPSSTPSDVPTMIPSDVPTAIPSDVPTDVPSDVPTDVPSDVPTDVPTMVPSAVPSPEPSMLPTMDPTKYPTYKPVPKPTKKPRAPRTMRPRPAPTRKPTKAPVLPQEQQVCKCKSDWDCGIYSKKCPKTTKCLYDKCV
jgi:hypothetical protein